MGEVLTLRDLTLMTILFVTVVGGIFLIRVLGQLGSVLSLLRKTLKDNKDNINSILKDMPKITEKAAEISSDAQVVVAALKEEQKVIDSTIQDISETIGAVSATAQAINEDVFSKVKALFSALSIVINMIAKRSGIEKDELPDSDHPADSFSKKEVIIKRGKKKRSKKQARKGKRV